MSASSSGSTGGSNPQTPSLLGSGAVPQFPAALAGPGAISPSPAQSPPAVSFFFPTPGTVIRSPTLVGRTYTIGEEFSDGGFSKVFSATDNWGKNLAVKVLRGSVGTYEEARALAAREAQTLRSLFHERITYVYEALEFQNAFYIITERCGPSVRTLLDEGDSGHLFIRGLAESVLDALGYIHDNGYVHQDIHAGNVFFHFAKSSILPERTAPGFKVGDLGLAKPIHLMNADNTVLNQAIFRAEVLAPGSYGPLDERLDIYHASLMMLQVLVGRELTFTPQEVLAGLPRQIAECLGEIGKVLSTGLRRRVHYRPTALQLWHELERVTR